MSKALVGTWEALPNDEGFSKQFYTFNADGTIKAIGIVKTTGVPGRSEGQGRWQVSHGYLIAEALKTPHDVLPIRFNVRAKIESIDNGTVKLRDKKGEEGELRRIAELPSLPPILVPTTVTPEQIKKFATYTPQPEYPIQARARHLSGDGFFVLRVQIRTGIVKDVQVERSTGSSILDSAAISAFKQWRFKPGALSRAKLLKLSLPETGVIQAEDYPVRVPVHFVMRPTS